MARALGAPVTDAYVLAALGRASDQLMAHTERMGQFIQPRLYLVRQMAAFTAAEPYAIALRTLHDRATAHLDHLHRAEQDWTQLARELEGAAVAHDVPAIDRLATAIHKRAPGHTEALDALDQTLVASERELAAWAPALLPELLSLVPEKCDLTPLFLDRQAWNEAACFFSRDALDDIAEDVIGLPCGKTVLVFERALFLQYLAQQPHQNIVGDCFRHPLTRELTPFSALRALLKDDWRDPQALQALVAGVLASASLFALGARWLAAQS